jgi:hypothetical protein
MKQVFILTTALLVLIISCTSKIDFTANGSNVNSIYASDLMISEISTAINTDPNANRQRSHYVEIFNGTSANLDLSNYAIGYLAVSNTDSLYDWSFPTTTYLPLTGFLDSGKCYVVVSKLSDTTLIPHDTTWGTTATNGIASLPLQLSGNSAIALLKKDAAGAFNLGVDNYKIIDVFGSPLVARVVSTGANSTRNNIMWAIAGESGDTRNRTIKRKYDVKNPTIDWNLSSGTDSTNSQWMLSGSRAWDYSNVGLPTQ